MRVSWLIVLIAVAVGCAPYSSAPKVSADTGVLGATKILAIARDAVSKNDTWVDRAEFHTPERRPDGSWSVLVWRLPKVPGGHRVILIDEKGKVTSYIRGA